ncbi:hypothetical protein N431DRAFT_391453 [Stipitochalara longipes BDJ]|nr:hypothetical protein N431DRAFT_391453 [Stipitochalara longipes BDJ]
MTAPQELFDALTNAERSLRINFRKRTFAERSPLGPKLNALLGAIRLHEIFSFFQEALEKVDRSWLPKGRIEQVVQACINGRYQEGDIERIFYEQGGIAGLLVLQLGTRNHIGLFAQIYALPVELKEELARQCGCEEISPIVQAWILSFGRSRTEFNPMEEPPRIDRFAKEKTEKGVSRQPLSKRIRIETNPETRSVASPPKMTPKSNIPQPTPRETGSPHPKDTLTCLAIFPAFLLND